MPEIGKHCLEHLMQLNANIATARSDRASAAAAAAATAFAAAPASVVAAFTGTLRRRSGAAGEKAANVSFDMLSEELRLCVVGWCRLNPFRFESAWSS